MSQEILIVDDDAFLLDLYKLNLQTAGFTIRTAADGQEAIAALDAKLPDLLILDLLMPKVDGFGVLEHIKQSGYGMPVIILSNLHDEVDTERCTSLGASAYFVKSDMDLDDLIGLAKEALT